MAKEQFKDILSADLIYKLPPLSKMKRKLDNKEGVYQYSFHFPLTFSDMKYLRFAFYMKEEDTMSNNFKIIN